MTPAADMATDTAKAQSISLANIVPQDLKLNGSSWRKVENATRKYASRAPGAVYVFTGPFFG